MLRPAKSRLNGLPNTAQGLSRALPRSPVSLFVSLAVIVCAAYARDAEARPSARSCKLPPISIAKLHGKTPRQVRATLSPVLGPPMVETNQLQDGGAFASLSEADGQDGVSQRFDWGGPNGSVEVVYQRGHAHLVSLRLQESATQHRGRTLDPCRPFSKGALAKAAGVRLPKKPTSARRLHGQTSYRFDLRTAAREQPSWMLRVRCHGTDRCVDLSVFFPLYVPRPGEFSLPVVSQRTESAPLPSPAVPIVVEKASAQVPPSADAAPAALAGSPRRILQPN